MVDLSLYQIPGLPVNVDSDITLQPCLLLEDKLLYTDMSSYLAELLVQSVTDKTQVMRLHVRLIDIINLHACTCTCIAMFHVHVQCMFSVLVLLSHLNFK